MGQMVWQKYLRGRYMHNSPIKFLLLQAIKKKKTTTLLSDRQPYCKY